jgi:hypothetical protein
MSDKKASSQLDQVGPRAKPEEVLKNIPLEQQLEIIRRLLNQESGPAKKTCHD